MDLCRHLPCGIARALERAAELFVVKRARTVLVELVKQLADGLAHHLDIEAHRLKAMKKLLLIDRPVAVGIPELEEADYARHGCLQHAEEHEAYALIV
jgi:hypothetical protein